MGKLANNNNQHINNYDSLHGFNHLCECYFRNNIYLHTFDIFITSVTTRDYLIAVCGIGGSGDNLLCFLALGISERMNNTSMQIIESCLTKKEKAVLYLMIETGNNRTETGRQLNITYGTVSVHLCNIRDVLGYPSVWKMLIEVAKLRKHEKRTTA